MILYKFDVLEEKITSYAVATSGIILLPTVVIPILNLIGFNKALTKLSNCTKYDYLTLEIKFNKELKDDISFLEKVAAFRKYALSYVLNAERVILIFDDQAAKIIKTRFPDLEFSKILFTNKKVEYTVEDFKQTYKPFFKLFGKFRKIFNVESAVTFLGVKDLPECARMNLLWLGIIMRQLIKYIDMFGAEKIIIKANKVTKME